MSRLGNRRHDRPHRSHAHDVMMGGANAQSLTNVDSARMSGERPRPEIQPVGKCQGRQRQVRAVQHGETLTSAVERRDHEVKHRRFDERGARPLQHGVWDVLASLDQSSSQGGPSGSRDVDTTRPRTRSFNHSSECFGPKTAPRSSIAFNLCRGEAPPSDTDYRHSIETLGSRKIGKSPNYHAGVTARQRAIVRYLPR